MRRHVLLGVAQYALIFNNKKQFLILQFGNLNSTNQSCSWVLPGGRLDKGEKDLIDSLHREVKEETDLEIEILFPFISEISDHTGTLTHKTCYLCKYLSGDVIVGNDGIIKYKWISYNEVPKYSFIGVYGDKMFKKFIEESKKFVMYLK